MFLYPLSGMVGGILYEHSHRLLGASVGFLTLILALGLWLKGPGLWLRWLGLLALMAVVLQGILGGLRVILLAQTLAIVHACLAQAFFALLVCITYCTADTRPENPVETSAEPLTGLRRLGLLTTGLIYLQIVFGAILRHTGNHLETHLALAGMVAVLVLVVNVHVWRHYGEQDSLVQPVMLLSGLLLAQLSLGLGAYLVKYTPMAVLSTPGLRVSLTTAHLALGSLLLATSLVLTLRTYRLGAVPQPLITRTLLPEQVS
jgi:cytochrome c oxidase assembly protein subunit 15